jgi:spore germination protein YaaH
MQRPYPRAVAISLALLLMLGASPVWADDPAASPPPAPAEATDGVVEQPTIHAEMLAAEAGVSYSFEPGAEPEPLVAAGPSIQGEDGVGGIAALPNGLSHEVFGYLPYWALSSSLRQYLRYDLVSSIAYFSVPVNADGALSSSGEGWSGWASANMTDVINRAHARGVRVLLTVTMMAWSGDYSSMSALLNSSGNRDRLAGQIAAAVKARNADGVNLDFEPVPNSLQSQYTTFVRETKAKLLATGAGSYLTVATTGGAASWDEGYDLVGLTATGAADAVMAMGYDFNWSGSARAGGVAPIDSPYVLDVGDAMAAYRAKLPGSKIIWGVPYYGRAWTTTGAELNARTCRSAGTCTPATWAPRYVDALEAIAAHGRAWDPNGLVPWYVYWSNTYGAWVEGYYDDAQSLAQKYSLVEAHGMRGVGIWHLLMDVERPELWSALKASFGTPAFTDIAESAFIEDITWLLEHGITNGCGDGRFCPTESVTRAQMASFIARALSLPAATINYFPDDAGTIFEADINRLAAAGITNGCGNGLYCPNSAVTRDQMASFIARALSLPAATADYFSDDAGSLHEPDINRMAAAGITNGCGGGVYCPTQVVTREQMAAFLHRALE